MHDQHPCHGRATRGKCVDEGAGRRAEGRNELQGVLDATLGRLEAAISATRSQEARATELLKQVLYNVSAFIGRVLHEN